MEEFVGKITEGNEEEEAFVLQKLKEYNRKQIPEAREHFPVRLVWRDAKGEVQGGIVGTCYWGCMHVRLFWVSEACRGKGIGSLLIRAMEERAVKEGCSVIHLETFEFQAKGFYLKHGYEIVGVINDVPYGSQYILKKKLG